MGKTIENRALEILTPSVRDSFKKTHTVSQPRMGIKYAWLGMSKASRFLFKSIRIHHIFKLFTTLIKS